jgi:signal transduction histidine kinase
MNHTGMGRNLAGRSGSNLTAATVGFAKDQQIADAPALLLGVPDAILANRLMAELKNVGAPALATVCTTLAQLKDLAAKSTPAAIFLDTDILAGRSLTEAVRQLSASAPVVVLASVSNQSEVARLVNCANVDFIGRVGDFVPLAAALVARQLHRSTRTGNAIEAENSSLTSEKMSELFRHEINNPLTGILGNAELVLAHRDHLMAIDVQRLQTVVDLAVRLRESILKIGDERVSPYRLNEIP